MDTANLFPRLDLSADPMVLLAFVLMLVWIFYWKGRALWIAARHSSVPWFIALLIINTFAILDILYIYYFSKKHKSN